MGDERDPGKFTIRFNIGDPQQQMVVELLNRQGRCKAQFIANAVLFYVYAASDTKTDSLGSVIQHILMGSRSAHQEMAPKGEFVNDDGAAAKPNIGESSDLGDADLDAIRKTMEAFQTA